MLAWRTGGKFMAVLLLIALLCPAPGTAQFGLDLTVVVAAINAIGSAITNVIGAGLRAINGALGALQGLISTLHRFFDEVVYPQAAINRARALIGAVQSLYANIRAIARINVASASLPTPRSLEGLLLSRDPLNIPAITARYQALYLPVPAPRDASPETRDLIDMNDAAAQAALKRSVAIDAIADEEMRAADRINQELQQAAPGTAPMLEAAAAAWLVRANAYTQSALADVIRVRSVALGNAGAQMKASATYAAETRQKTIDSLK